MPRSEIDLHCHSLASDGELAPSSVVQRACENGVRVLALTDHDTLSGFDEARSQANQLGIVLIPGIEFSTQWRGYGIHILGLNFDPEHESIIGAVKRQTQARQQRSQVIAEKLIKKGMPDLLPDALKAAGHATPGRPHFAQAMLSAGLVRNHQEAFKKYLGAGKAGDVKMCWPEVSEAVEWIAQAGGTAVIAHPRKYDMTLTKLRLLIEDFVQAGGAGLEVIVAGQKQGETGLLTDLCRRYGMQASIGSDFHSTRFPWADLGHIASLPDGLEAVWDSWELPLFGQPGAESEPQKGSAI